MVRLEKIPHSEAAAAAQERAVAAAQLLQDMHGRELILLDMRAVCNFVDYLVIVSATSITQTRGFSDAVEQHFRQRGLRPAHKEGYRDGGWVLLDYGSLMVHIFEQDKRDFYALERLWQDARRVSIPLRRSPA